MRTIFLFMALVCTIVAAAQRKATGLDRLAEDYVKLGLAIGQYDGDFVDAYYGPEEWKPKGDQSATFPKDSFLRAIDGLKAQLRAVRNDGRYSQEQKDRARWIIDQLTAFGRRVRIFSGETASFEIECKELFGIVPPKYEEAHFQKLIARLDRMLPGRGTVAERYNLLASRFIIPNDKLDTVFRAAIAESRSRTLRHYPLPANEDFRLEFVKDKPWTGYNWYKGNFQSLIQLNTDRTMYIDRAIDVASHESYPGHHVYNALLEQKLYRQKGWAEICLYPLFSPQSFIAEGSANYGIDVVFPGKEKIRVATKLLRLAGLDTAGVTLYFDALEIFRQLNYARNEAARGWINGTLTEEQAVAYLVRNGLNTEADAPKNMRFIKAYRSYVINYNYGLDLVKKNVEKRGGKDPAKRWSVFRTILSQEVRPVEL